MEKIRVKILSVVTDYKNKMLNPARMLCAVNDGLDCRVQCGDILLNGEPTDALVSFAIETVEVEDN